MGDGLKFHYSNPKFAGKPWAVDRPKKKQQKKKTKHRRKRERLELSDIPNVDKYRDLINRFWNNFEGLPNTQMRLDYLRSVSNPGWPRVSEEVRLKLRKQFAKRYRMLLVNIDDQCGVCGDGVWHEKHHVIPLSYGGMNESLNLIAICESCHNKIHPWLEAGDR